MANIIARIKAKGKNYEILVDSDKALQFRQSKGNISISDVLAFDEIFTDHKKGLKAPQNELEVTFGTSDVYTIAEKILRQGELQLSKEYRDKAREEKIKQVSDFISKNAVDPRTGNSYTQRRIEELMDQAGAKVDNRPAEEQIPKILETIQKLVPIKIETKKLSIKIPATFSGKAYGLLQGYKESEEWLSNGDLLVIINIPAGMQMQFYDKLNSITHGNSVVEEIKEKQ